MKRRLTQKLAVLFALFLILFGNSPGLAQNAPSANPDELVKQSSKKLDALASKLVFEENKGQFDSAFRFRAMDRQAEYVFLPNAMRVKVKGQNSTVQHEYGMRFLSSNPSVEIKGTKQAYDPRRGRVSYVTQQGMVPDVPMYENLEYHNLWNQVDVQFKDTREGMKYDFVVKPGARPDAVQLQMDGVEDVAVTPEGELSFKTPLGVLKKGKPFTYQWVDGKKVEIPSAYKVEGSVISFEVGAYDKNRNLIIDPIALKFATVLNDPGYDLVTLQAIIDPGSKNIYMTGFVDNGGITYTNNPTLSNSNSEAFILCMAGDGSRILWSTYFYNNDDSYGRGIALGDYGDVYVVIYNYGGDDYQITPAVQGVSTARSTSEYDHCLFRLNATGNTVKYFSVLTPYVNTGTYPTGEPDEDAEYGFGKVLYVGNGKVNISYTIYEMSASDVVEFQPTAGAINDLRSTSGSVTAIYTIDTDIAGKAGLLHAAYISEFLVTDAAADAAGNIYLVGKMYDDYNGDEIYAHSLFTDKTIDPDMAANGSSIPDALFKLNSSLSTVLYGSLIGFDAPDYWTSVGPQIAVDGNENVFFFDNFHYEPSDYSSIEAAMTGVTFPATVNEVNPFAVEIYYDEYVDFAAIYKLPASDYAKPEWINVFNGQYDDYQGNGGIDVDSKGRIHVAWTATESTTPAGPLATDGAFTVAETTDDVYDLSQYAVFSATGALLFATPIGSQEDHDDYSFETNLALDRASGNALVYISTYDYFDESIAALPYTPSYRNPATGQKVEVLNANAAYFVDDGYRTYLAMFHEPPFENTITPFASGADQFCVGSLISQGSNFGPIQGSNPVYVSGDGSLATHNLPLLYIGGAPVPFPEPKARRLSISGRKV